MFNRKNWWSCTKCTWKGHYSETVCVMYSGVDWQHCPSCNSIVIPLGGSTAPNQDWRIVEHGFEMEQENELRHTKKHETPIVNQPPLCEKCWRCHYADIDCKNIKEANASKRNEIPLL